MKKFWIPLALFALLIGLLTYGLSLDPKKIPSPLVGKPLPAFDLPMLEDPRRRLTNADFRGKPFLINVWASWCAACKQEHPALLALAGTRRVALIGLNYKDKPEDAKQVLAQDGNPYDLSVTDMDGRTGIDWGVYGVPETFVVDAQGIIRYKHIGPVTEADLQQKLLPCALEARCG